MKRHQRRQPEKRQRQPVTQILHKGAETKHSDPNYHQPGRRQQTQQAPQVRKTATGTSAIKFSGRIDDLKGHIYDVVYGQQAYAFVKTTEEISGYAGRTCKQSTEIRATIKKL